MECKDRDWLYTKYIDEALNIYQIAKICRCHPRTIHQRLVKFGIPRRKGGVEQWSEEQKEYRRQWNRTHPNVITGMRGKKHSEETKRKMSLTRRGRGNSNWKGGLTELIKGIRRSPEFYQWRKAVLERDNHTCQDCGATDNLEAHHIRSIIEYPEGIFDVGNGLTLCSKCHKKHTWWQKIRAKKTRRKGKSTLQI